MTKPSSAERFKDRTRLERQVWALEAYANAAKCLRHAKTPQELIEGICEGITKLDVYLLAWVGLAENNADKTVSIAGAFGQAKPYTQGLTVSWDKNKATGKGPCGRAITSGEIQLVCNIDDDHLFAPWSERAKFYGVESYIAVPIFDDGTAIGALLVYANITNAFNLPEISLFESLAQEIGHGLASFKQETQLKQEKIRRESAQRKLLESLELTITAMSSTMEMRDPYTSGHQQQVAKISVAIAQSLNLTEDQIHGLKMAALVHDIGKVAIPYELLTKPTQLSPLEYELMKEHVNNGYKILKDIPFVWPIADMVRQHHERSDGTGYPLGLKGDQILEEAKILAVADIIDSMSSHRPYRPALGVEKAIDEIQRRAGHDLDKNVVDAAIRLYESGELQTIIRSGS
jgi:response regulator RpfG family c-di-GMP phosphodiesterase